MQKILLSLFLLGSIAGPGVAQEATIKVPYQPQRVYTLRLIPGAPAMVELPAGEQAKNIWFDKAFFIAESTPDTNRVVVKALNTPEAVGKSSYVHIETEPSNLRISLKVMGVADSQDVPGVLTIYLDGADEGTLVNAQVAKRLRQEVPYAQKFASEQAETRFEAWRANLMKNFNDKYSWGGDFPIDRVTDDKVQTWVYMPNASDKAVIELIDKAGHPEKVNYELENGAYVVQNKVLRNGEKWHLILGKEQAWIKAK